MGMVPPAPDTVGPSCAGPFSDPVPTPVEGIVLMVRIHVCASAALVVATSATLAESAPE